MKLPDGIRITAMRVSADGRTLDISLVRRDALRRVEHCIWSEGPGPYKARQRPFPDDITTLCGRELRAGGIWQRISCVTAELLLHHASEDEALCRGCVRELAAHPVNCSAGASCTGDLLCRG